MLDLRVGLGPEAPPRYMSARLTAVRKRSSISFYSIQYFLHPHALRRRTCFAGGLSSLYHRVGAKLLCPPTTRLVPAPTAICGPLTVGYISKMAGAGENGGGENIAVR